MARSYNQYREIAARFESKGTCGHEIHKGDVIGYSPAPRKWLDAETQCAECWRKWSADVANEQEYCNGY